MGGLFDWPSNKHEKQMHAGRQGLMRLALRGGANLLTCMGESYAAQECLRFAQLLDTITPTPTAISRQPPCWRSPMRRTPRIW